MLGKIFVFGLTVVCSAALIYAAHRNERVKKEYDELLNRIRQGIKSQ